MEILYPVKPVFITNPYGTVAPWYGARGHTGVDFRTHNESLEIKAVADGKVIQVIDNVKDWFYYDNGWKKTSEYGKGDAYGCNIIIDHGGYYSVYGHCSKIFVKLNDEVRAGTTIAHGGNTGHSMGVHLHFELRIGGSKLEHCVNPMQYFVDSLSNQPSEWAKEAQKFVVDNNISDGKRPHDNITREEVWVMIMRSKLSN